MLTRLQSKLKEAQQINVHESLANPTAAWPTKRKAVESPEQFNGGKMAPKRSAFCDLTNAFQNVKITNQQQQLKKGDAAMTKKLTSVKSTDHQTKIAAKKCVEEQKKKSPAAKLAAKVKSKENQHDTKSTKAKKSAISSASSGCSSYHSSQSSLLHVETTAVNENVESSKAETILSTIPSPANSFASPASKCSSSSFESMEKSSLNQSTSTETMICSYLSNLNFSKSHQLLVNVEEKEVQNVFESSDENCATTIVEEVAEDAVPEYDYDKENEMDPFNVPEFAWDIFQYYNQRENHFKVSDYMHKQTTVTHQMRSILVDWMVEIQESFELNHETLYQAVKMTDLYLEKRVVDKRMLQLVGTSALFISSKFDERCPPACEDFLYICDDAYTREQLLAMERDMLKILQFDLGFPLSYRFLRRYAKTTKLGMETLTLARYILESSLMHYEFISYKESLMAGACLLLALKMKNEGEWGNIHKKYSGYKAQDLEPIALRINDFMVNSDSDPKMSQLVNIKNKYSHEVFFHVTRVPFLPVQTTTSTTTTHVVSS